MNGLQAVAVHVCVQLGRVNAGVAQKFLHGAQVGAAGQEMRGKAMPQGVWADLGVEAGIV